MDNSLSGSEPVIRCVVTGGSGFLGRVLIERLISSATRKWIVKVFDIREVDIKSTYKCASDSDYNRISCYKGNLCNYQDILHVITDHGGCDIVFHCASAAPTAQNANNYHLMHSVNVIGTENLITACKESNVSRIVYTSSASVVFDGSDLNKVDESHPIPDSFLDFYSQTKAQAEQLILNTNCIDVLYTVSLRPSGIFGEYDPLFVPSLVDKARKGKMKFIIGNGENGMDWTYVRNVAQAHELAAIKLFESPKEIAGEAFFITNDEPRSFWGFMGDILFGLGYEKPKIMLPFALIYAIAVIISVITWIMKPVYEIETDLTPSRIRLSVAHRNVSCEKAKLKLGYIPEYSMDEALAKTVEHFAHLRKDNHNGIHNGMTNKKLN